MENSALKEASIIEFKQSESSNATNDFNDYDINDQSDSQKLIQKEQDSMNAILTGCTMSEAWLKVENEIKVWSTQQFADLTKIETIRKLAIQRYPHLHKEISKFIDMKFIQKKHQNVITYRKMRLAYLCSVWIVFKLFYFFLE